MSEPARTWRVHTTTGFTTDHRSMATAFEQVKAVHRYGLAAAVYRWGNGRWELYRHLEPPAEPAAASEDNWPF
ncbi:MAG: hypothetical protein JO016_17695 [Actinobacteria bacterium]|nr:hypothetical protein [Actinomycetota bacterium]